VNKVLLATGTLLIQSILAHQRPWQKTNRLQKTQKWTLMTLNQMLKGVSKRNTPLISRAATVQEQ
jgi:hypothetical protein